MTAAAKPAKAKKVKISLKTLVLLLLHTHTEEKNRAECFLLVASVVVVWWLVNRPTFILVSSSIHVLIMKVSVQSICNFQDALLMAPKPAATTTQMKHLAH